MWRLLILGSARPAGRLRRKLAGSVSWGRTMEFLRQCSSRLSSCGWPVRIVHTHRTAYWLPEVSDIFHGRDVFAPVAAHWAAGVPIEALGDVIADPVHLALPRPQPTAQGLTGEVTLIFQHFGNLITNIHRDDLDDWSQVIIRLCGVEIDGLVRTFGDRQPGTLIALFGSSGHLMIAVVNGRATDRLHPSIGDQVEVIRQT